MAPPRKFPAGRRAGAAAWLASAVILPVQVVVALRWPEGYSLTHNAMSDLGVTSCGQFSEQGQQVRQVCSPWHSLFNAGMVVGGALIATGAVLLHGWWEGRSGRAGTVLMVLCGLLVALAGLAPWDLRPDLHDTAALGQGLAQWLAMVLIAVAAGPGRFRRLTVGAVLVSLAGFAAFVAALEGNALPVLGFGIAERLSFDILALWPVLVGAAILLGHPLRGRAADTPASSLAVT